jgi:hypothetical protein
MRTEQSRDAYPFEWCFRHTVLHIIFTGGKNPRLLQQCALLRGSAGMSRASSHSHAGALPHLRARATEIHFPRSTFNDTMRQRRH